MGTGLTEAEMITDGGATRSRNRPRKVLGVDQAFRDRLGAIVRRRRSRLKLSQSELARRAGLNNTTIYFLENGQRGLTVESLLALAGALEVRPAAFFRGIK